MSQTIISLIVAKAENDVIGVDNTLPWRLKRDMQWFRQHTMGKPIVMGRHTWESIGKPLPGRRNIVVSTQLQQAPAGTELVKNLAAALELCIAEPEVMIIGGSQLYQAALPLVSRLYVTEVAAQPAGDAYFTMPNLDVWQLTYTEAHAIDDDNDHACQMNILQKIA